MYSIFFIHAIKVRPDKSSELLRTHPKAKGAYLDCYVAADTEDDAVNKSRQALEIDGYVFIQHEELRELYRDGDWLYDEMPPGVREKAEEVLESGDIVYGEFHVW